MKAHSAVTDAKGPILFRAIYREKPDGSVVEDSTLLCSYCGSLTIDETLSAFKTSGMRYAGSEWKHGIPHDFAIMLPGKAPRKFCSVHMLDATPEQIEAWNQVVMPLVGVGFAIDEKGVKYGAVKAGHQASGVVA